MTDDPHELPLPRRLRREILIARERVYRLGAPTPLEPMRLDGGVEIWVKREDLSPIKAYKWRGAYNRMAVLAAEEKARGVITASAGNHAQGVALAAARLEVRATIFMPRTTPGVKQRAVRRWGGEWVEIRLEGDAYDDALNAALAFQKETGGVYIHAYDDLLVMAGQGTLADEVVLSGAGPFDVAYLQIGGGGMAAAVACWLREFYPGIELVGVEGVGQASMKQAIESGRRERLAEMDIFCDGTAVRMPGELPFAVCREVLDRIITVTNTEVADAIRIFWDELRCLSEPSGAMGLAGALQERARLGGRRALVVLCGANIDFSRLGAIATSSGIDHMPRHYLRIEISEEAGSMLRLLDLGLGELNIVAFQYGKRDAVRAWPLFGLACAADDYAALEARLRRQGFAFEAVEDSAEIPFRMIALRPELLGPTVFLDLEFYERAGALHAFLVQTIQGRANFCYFNYAYSGERVGRALIGLEFNDLGARAAFLESLSPQGPGYRFCRPLDERTVEQFLGIARENG
ncbi:MAG: pyridoxal-phosphate dependent enzyme [Opitutales bacterium]